MSNLIVIPARYGSSRFPGKPLAVIAGKTMIQRVWEIAKRVNGVDRVVVATDDQRIVEKCKQFGAEVVLTKACENGTERALAAVDVLAIKPEVIINFQGDAVTTPPAMIGELLEFMRSHPQAEMGTLAKRLDEKSAKDVQNAKDPGKTMTFVTFAIDGRALYFSRARIPNVRDSQSQVPPFHKHVGIYAYRLETLRRYVSLSPTVLENAEKLEQLRALENGIPIHVVVSKEQRTLVSVDNPEDIARVEAALQAEGEP